MARYIDAVELQRRICRAKCGCEYEDCVCEGDCVFEHFIFHSPTADVAPRAEVAREIFEEIEKIRLKEIHKCETLREKESDPSERKYWEGGTHSLLQLSYWIAELKKKYTETEGE